MAALIILGIAVAAGWQYFREIRSPQPAAGPSPTATPNYDAARQQTEALPFHRLKRVYQLWASGNEKDALRRVLRDC